MKEKQENYYEWYWNKIEKNSNYEVDSFVRDYLSMKKLRIPNIGKVYVAFKEYLEEKQIADIEPVLVDLTNYSRRYKTLLITSDPKDELEWCVFRLNKLETNVARPFLLEVLRLLEEQTIANAEAIEILTTVENFVFRRIICDVPTNALNKIFATLHTAVLKSKRETDTYSSVMIYILESKKLSSSFPKDEEFINGFTTKKVYSMQAKNKMYIFERLENGSSVEKNDVVENIEQGILTIEHIMPQTLSNTWKQDLGADWEEIQEKWLHTISNLTLSGYNIKYSNRPFAEKRDMENGFKQSGLRLNHYIAQFDKWSEEELEKRKQELSRLAKTIWSYPETGFEPEVIDDDIVSLSEDNGISTGRKIQYYIFQDEREDVDEWSEMMWAVINKLFAINPHYKKIAEGLYYCPSRSSTWNKMAILKNLFRLYQIDEDDLQFGVKPVKQ